MDDPNSSGNNYGNRLSIGLFTLIGWHVISLPFMIWALVTGIGGMICGPSDQFMVLTVAGFIDFLLLLFSLIIAVSKRKLFYLPLLINLAALAIVILVTVLRSLF